MNEVDSSFLLPTRVLDFTAARARALQTNLAHASEPGYKRVDVDFDALIKAVRAGQDGRGGAGDGSGAGALATTRPSIAVDVAAPAGPSGNSVEFEREQVQIDKNALLHELATFFLNGKLNSLRSAIRGSAS